MAPGNLYIGYHRSHLTSKPYPLRNSTARNCSRITMEVTKETDDLSKVDVGSVGKINGSENNPILDSNCNKNMGKGKSDGDGNGSVKNSWLTESRLRTQIRKLRSLSLLHLDVIDQQQRQLSAREQELSKVRSEKHTLQQRLERMQRRTSLAEKASKSPCPGQKTTEVNTATKRKLDVASSPTLKRTTTREGVPPKQSRLQQLALARERKRQKPPRGEEGQSQLNGAKVDAEDNKDKLKAKSSESVEEPKKVPRLEDRFLFTDILYPTLQDLRISLPQQEFSSCTPEVEIPSWRTFQQHPAEPLTGEIEDVDDETYDRRHSKMEQEEKKRKRWDAQRIRELRTIERLEWRAVQKEMAKYAHILTKYSSEPHDAKRVEVSESIPVIAFGALVPKLKNQGFSLPWFNLADKERDETRRHTRSRASKK